LSGQLQIPFYAFRGDKKEQHRQGWLDICGQTHTRLCLVLQLLDDIVPNLVARAEALEKRARAAAKIAAQLNNVVPDDNGHYGRSRRQRTQVSMADGANTVHLHTHNNIIQ